MKPIYPPRPRGKINPSDLLYYEKQGRWIAQRKFNDSRNLLHVAPGRQMSVWSRHGAAHKRFVLTNALRRELEEALKLDIRQEYWIDGGVLNKTKNATESLVFFDILQAGRYFFGSPDQMTRLDILFDLCGSPTQKTENGLALQVSPNIWLAETFEKDFQDRYKEAENTDLIEGLVLRRRDSTLDNFGRVEYEVDWQLRCRKPHKNYNF